MESRKFVDWAIELQALAQAGLYYTKDIYDAERFQRIREIAAEMLASQCDLPSETVRDLFCGETGYQTPKLDSRGVIIKDGKILLVQEKDGRWSLPGGWVDANLSVKENVMKEVKEEAGLDVSADRIIAVQDRKKNNPEVHAFNICKVFILCSLLGGSFQPNSETVASGYFAPDNLPPLAENKTTAAQIKMCFDAYSAENWVTLFD